MALLDLIDSSEKCHKQLLSAIHNDADFATVQALDEHLSYLVNSIRNLHLSESDDINRQIKFFLQRSESLDDSSMSSLDLEAAESLIDRYIGVNEAPSKIGDQQSTVSAQAIVDLGNSPFLTDELIDQSESRIALINADYRYEYTSLGNARFHNTNQKEFVGKHMADIVGDRRFKNRAKQYFDNCFGGEHQKYSYFLDVPELGERVMHCQLTPYRDGDGAVRGSFVTIEDVSEKLQKASEAAASNLVA